MNSAAVKGFRRQLRKAAGAEAVDHLNAQSVLIKRAHALLFQRSFWGRLRWLVTGR